MMFRLPANTLTNSMTPEQLYQLTATLLDKMEAEGSDSLTDEQHTLIAYCYLDSQVQEGGFIQLIASGYGDYIFNNPVSDSLRRWHIKTTPKILDKVKPLYLKYGNQIERLIDKDHEMHHLRQQFNEFEEFDANYYECSDDDIQLICQYVERHLNLFQTNNSHATSK